MLVLTSKIFSEKKSAITKIFRRNFLFLLSEDGSEKKVNIVVVLKYLKMFMIGTNELSNI